MGVSPVHFWTIEPSQVGSENGFWRAVVLDRRGGRGLPPSRHLQS